jgi:hypothetical protein
LPAGVAFLLFFPFCCCRELKDFLRHAGNVTYANVQQDGTG